MMPAFQAVMEAMFAMAVGIDHLFRPVFFRNGRESAVSFHYVCGRIMQEHNEAAEAVLPGGLKGDPQPFHFPVNQVVCR